MVEDNEALMKEGKWDEAETALLDFVSLHPENSQGHALLGLCLGRKGEISTASVQFQCAWILDPRNWEAGKNLLKCYEYLGSHKEALELAHGILRVRPSDPDITRAIEKYTAILKSKKPIDDRDKVWGR